MPPGGVVPPLPGSQAGGPPGVAARPPTASMTAATSTPIKTDQTRFIEYSDVRILRRCKPRTVTKTRSSRRFDAELAEAAVIALRARRSLRSNVVLSAYE